MEKEAALITGGSDRIGRSVALTLAGSGYDIALHYGTSEAKAIQTKNEIMALGVKCNIYQRDLSNTESVISLTQEILNEMNLSILINSASVFIESKFTDPGYDEFNRTFDINFKSPYILSKEFSRAVKSGHIINFLDTKISNNSTDHFNYLLTKKFLSDFTKMAAKELAPGIRVNAIAPGPVLPPPGKAKEYLEKAGMKTPLKRHGTLKAIDNAILYLTENKYITGQTIYLDGGENL